MRLLSLVILHSSIVFSQDRDPGPCAWINEIPVLAGTSYTERVLHPGPRQAAPVYLQLGEFMVGAESGADLPVNVIGKGRFDSQHRPVVAGGRYLPAGEAVWLVQRRCTSYNERIEFGSHRMIFTFRTDRSYPLMVNGTSVSNPLSGVLHVGWEDAQRLGKENFFTAWKKVVASEPATVGSTATIRTGSSPEDVISVHGQPLKTVEVGSKLILVYQNLKFTFQDRKLVDAE